MGCLGVTLPWRFQIRASGRRLRRRGPGPGAEPAAWCLHRLERGEVRIEARRDEGTL